MSLMFYVLTASKDIEEFLMKCATGVFKSPFHMAKQNEPLTLFKIMQQLQTKLVGGSKLSINKTIESGN